MTKKSNDYAPVGLMTVEQLRLEVQALERRPFNARARWAMRLFEVRKEIERRGRGVKSET
jgi:hypothetical protein